MIYNIENLDPSVEYIDFIITQENRNKIGYTDTISELVIPVAFKDTDGKWYKVTELENATSYSKGVFSNCTNLGKVVIPSSVTSIGNSAFEYCINLTNVDIPSSVTSIGINAFYNIPHITYNGTASGAPWGAFSMN